MQHRERNRGQSDCFSGVGGKLHSARDTLEGTCPGLGALRNPVLFKGYLSPLGPLQCYSHVAHLILPVAVSLTTGPLHSLSSLPGILF